MIHERNELRIYRENNLMTMNLLDASVDAGVKRFFFASSACVYPENLQSNEHEDVSLQESDVYPSGPQGLYGTEKLNTEQTLRSLKNGILFQIARFHNVYGPRGLGIVDARRLPQQCFERRSWPLGSTTTPALSVLTSRFGEVGINEGVSLHRRCCGRSHHLLRSDYQGPVNVGSDWSVTIRDLADIALRCVALPPVGVHFTLPKATLLGSTSLELRLGTPITSLQKRKLDGSRRLSWSRG